MSPITPTDASEETLQRAIWQLLEWHRKMGRLLAFHVPNGGKRNAREAARLAGMGVVAGAPDLAVLWPGGRVEWWELKTLSGRQSPAQVEFQRAVEQLGHRYLVVRSVDEAAELLAGV